jgi:hypothetical protein
MNQDHYDYIYQIHENQREIAHLNSIVQANSPRYPTFRKRFLLSMSDALLGLGQRIRPAEFRVKIQGNQSPDVALDIKAEGC